MNKGSLALLPFLLCGGCSLTFYGLKEIKDEPKPKTALACVEPKPAGTKQLAAASGKKPAVATKAPPKLTPEATATAAAPPAPAPPVPAEEPRKDEAQPADPGPDTHSQSVATKP
jgi:hypothetical protein